MILHRWAFLRKHLTGLVSYVVPGNTASRNVLEKLGADRTGRMLLMGTVEAERWRHRTPT